VDVAFSCATLLESDEDRNGLTGGGTSLAPWFRCCSRARPRSANRRTFHDPLGDVTCCTRDLTDIRVNNGDAGTITFDAAFDDRYEGNDDDDDLDLILHTDQNPATGESLGGCGFAYAIYPHVRPDGIDSASLSACKNNAFHELPGRRVQAKLLDHRIVISVDRHRLRDTNGFAFSLQLREVTSLGGSYREFAPNTGAWTFPVKIALARLRPSLETEPPRPAAGGRFLARLSFRVAGTHSLLANGGKRRLLGLDPVLLRSRLVLTRTSTVAAAVAALTLALGAGGAVATPAANGPIYFVGSRAPDFLPEIYSVAADGTGRLDLTNNAAADESPAVSPDGRQIAFVSTRDGYEALYVMNADGGDAHRVCPQASLPAGPCITDDQGAGALGDLAWSPTGRTLAVRVVFPGPAICLAPADGNYLLDLPDGRPRQLGYGLLGPVRFSADGRFVASASWSCIEGGTLSVARADSGQETGGVRGLFENWAPRGLRLLYDRGKRGEQGDYPTVYPATMDPFGRHRWTLRRIPETAPTWSPSGRRIAFFRASGRRQGLYVVHVGRHDARRIRRFVYDVRRSAWSPNGKWIAFGGAEGTYFVRSNGTGLRRVSGAAPMSPYSPLLWSPDSSHFAFVDGDGVVRVVSPPQRAAVPVTSAASDLDVCRVAIDLPVCQIAWAGDRLVFASHGPQATHLFAFEQDGSGLRQVAPDNAPLGQVSPDGSRVAFVRDSNIWTARLDGSDQRQVTSGDLPDASPAWSPDGTQLAFLRQTSTPSSGDFQIFTVGASGGQVHQVTNPDSPIQVGNGAGHLAWSPDGSWLLSVRLLVHPDGSGLQLLDVPDSCNCEPYGWSPDSTKLALGGRELAVMNLDGSAFRQLNEPSARGADEPAWSPDGTKIVFVRWHVPAELRGPTSDSDLWTINADGSGEQQLTSGPWPDTVPAWLPRP